MVNRNLKVITPQASPQGLAVWFARALRSGGADHRRRASPEQQNILTDLLDRADETWTVPAGSWRELAKELGVPQTTLRDAVRAGKRIGLLDPESPKPRTHERWSVPSNPVHIKFLVPSHFRMP